MQIKLYTPLNKDSWDSYVLNHPASTHCHLQGWKDVIENAYGHKGYYFLAEEHSKTKGILPVFHFKSFLFGNHLVSMPFLNYGGILADDEQTEIALLSEAVKLGQKLKASTIELRHTKPLSCLNALNSVNSMNRSTATLQNSNTNELQHGSPDVLPRTSSGAILKPQTKADPINFTTKTHKVRLLLKLPPSKEELLKSFKSKLRSQISRPQKEGMNAVIGGVELLDSFYEVFSINMRDLGSPVHSKKLFKQICYAFPQNIEIGVVDYENNHVAAGLIFCFRDTVEIPWASSLKQFNRFSPNMLLYWKLMEYACDQGFKYFDLGRSSPDEGTQRFKEQWGAKPFPLYWHNIMLNGQPARNNEPEKSKYVMAIRYWKKLPIPISNMIGPLIRKHISL